MHYVKYQREAVSRILIHSNRGIDSLNTHEHSNESIDNTKSHLKERVMELEQAELQTATDKT